MLVEDFTVTFSGEAAKAIEDGAAEFRMDKQELIAKAISDYLYLKGELRGGNKRLYLKNGKSTLDEIKL